MSQPDNIIQELIYQCIFRLDDNAKRIKLCLSDLLEDEIWKKPNNASNSIGNLILHLCGNIAHFIGASLGKNGYIRDRSSEFLTRGGYTKAQLIQHLDDTLSEAKSIIKKLDSLAFLEVQTVSGFRYSGLGMVVHVVQHFALHTGQNIFWTKILRDKDLGYSSEAPNQITKQTMH